MSWLRIDDQFLDNPKVMQLQRMGDPVWRDASHVWLSMGLHCARNNTDGVVDIERVCRLAYLRPKRVRTMVDAMVKVGMLRRDGDLLTMHDFTVYNPSRAQVMAKREANTAARRTARAGRKATAETTFDPLSSHFDPTCDRLLADECEQLRGVRPDVRRHEDSPPSPTPYIDGAAQPPPAPPTQTDAKLKGPAPQQQQQPADDRSQLEPPEAACDPTPSAAVVVAPPAIGCDLPQDRLTWPQLERLLQADQPALASPGAVPGRHVGTLKALCDSGQVTKAIYREARYRTLEVCGRQGSRPNVGLFTCKLGQEVQRERAAVDASRGVVQWSGQVPVDNRRPQPTYQERSIMTSIFNLREHKARLADGKADTDGLPLWLGDGR